MNFGDALEHVRDGGRARRPEWPPGSAMTLASVREDGGEPIALLVCRRPGVPAYPWGRSDRDILGTDWVLL